MKEIGNCPTGDAIRARVCERQRIQGETVPVLFLSTALLAVGAQLRAELGDDNGLGVIILVAENNSLNMEAGLDLHSEMVVQGERFLQLRSLVSFDSVHDVVPDLKIEQPPCWHLMNDHPRGPGPNQRKGGKSHRPQKHKR